MLQGIIIIVLVCLIIGAFRYASGISGRTTDSNLDGPGIYGSGDTFGGDGNDCGFDGGDCGGDGGGDGGGGD